MNNLAIIGAGGHGKVVADVALSVNPQLNIVFFDDNYPNNKSLEIWKIVGTPSDYIQNKNTYPAVIVAIGDNRIRAKVCKNLISNRCRLTTIIHRNSTVSPYAKIGNGSIIMAGAIINPFVTIGTAAIINTNSNIDHDCNLGDYVHISPGANLAGNITIGNFTWIGTGVIIIPSVKVTENVTIGAGSLVIRNINKNGVYAGNPLRKLEDNFADD